MQEEGAFLLVLAAALSVGGTLSQPQAQNSWSLGDFTAPTWPVITWPSGHGHGIFQASCLQWHPTLSSSSCARPGCRFSMLNLCPRELLPACSRIADQLWSGQISLPSNGCNSSLGKGVPFHICLSLGTLPWP